MELIIIMNQTASIDVSELKFYEGKEDPWKVFPEEPIRGTVGCYAANRAGSFDMFIVIDYDKTNGKMHVIMPRMRIDKYEDVIFGNDKLIENFKTTFDCECNDDDLIKGGCRCGVDKKIFKEYAKTFKPTKPGYEYKVTQLSKADSSIGLLQEFVKREMINDLDNIDANRIAWNNMKDIAVKEIEFLSDEEDD